jgi:hypothetical protein
MMVKVSHLVVLVVIEEFEKFLRMVWSDGGGVRAV